MSNRPAKVFFLLVIVIVAGIALVNLLTSPASLFGPGPKSVSIGQLLQDIRSGNLSTIEWQEATVAGEYKNGDRFTAHYVKPSEPAATALVTAVQQANADPDDKKHVKLTVLDPPASSTLLSILGIIAFPLMLIALVYFLVLRPAHMGAARQNWSTGENLADQLTRLSNLRDRGFLSEEEFAKAKAKLLDDRDSFS